MPDDESKINDSIDADKDKWDFSDYAFTITGIIVGILLVVPEILESQFGISILGGSLTDAFENGVDYGGWSFNQLRALSPLLFLVTTSVVFFQEAFEARKTGGYKGSLFTNTFESLFEDAIYMTITTIMVFSAVLGDVMYISWLAGPITWILFIFIFPFVKKKRKKKRGEATEADEADMPWILMGVFAAGIIAEVITGAWIAFPLAWLIICAVKFVDAFRVLRDKDDSPDTVFNLLYYAFSVVLLALGITLNFWITSWIAFPFAILICWVLNKIKKVKQVKQV